MVKLFIIHPPEKVNCPCLNIYILQGNVSNLKMSKFGN